MLPAVERRFSCNQYCLHQSLTVTAGSWYRVLVLWGRQEWMQQLYGFGYRSGSSCIPPAAYSIQVHTYCLRTERKWSEQREYVLAWSCCLIYTGCFQNIRNHCRRYFVHTHTHIHIHKIRIKGFLAAVNLNYSSFYFGRRGTLLVTQLVKALRYKPEGRGFDSWRSYWNFSLT